MLDIISSYIQVLFRNTIKIEKHSTKSCVHIFSINRLDHKGQLLVRFGFSYQVWLKVSEIESRQ